MSRCEHTSWLEFIEDEGGPQLAYGWRFQRVIEELPRPTEQYPQITLLVGKRQKRTALGQLCENREGRHHRKSPINLRADNRSIRSTNPRFFADCDPELREILPAINSPKFCHRQENLAVNWPRSTPWKYYDLVLTRLLFLFVDVICVFADDLGGLDAAKGLLMEWASIGSASSLPVRPRVIVVHGGESCASVTQSVLDETNFLFDLQNPSNTLFHSSFSNVRLSTLPPREHSPGARYLQLSGDILTELCEAQQDRVENRILFSASHLNHFFDDALEHIRSDIFTPFNFIESSRKSNPLDGSFILHLLAFLGETIRVHTEYSAVASYIASAILMDAYPRAMHGR